ncbi:hypothetical protein BsIDN1_28550 [Bacillus safensis]|uniref:Uncharacterized protein n=1 Tax=Bacillus safensis TaxID=561879 RepID=A0A5S9M6V4_BACIA|nr:hypothetical protein BsIDN1_28550 [Bacillus safensis]
MKKHFSFSRRSAAGAGRHEKAGSVIIIQSYTPSHYSIELTKQHDYEAFYEQEMLHRRHQSYPPYYFLAMVTVSHEEVTKAAHVTDQIVQFLK